MSFLCACSEGERGFVVIESVIVTIFIGGAKWRKSRTFENFKNPSDCPVHKGIPHLLSPSHKAAVNRSISHPCAHSTFSCIVEINHPFYGLIGIACCQLHRNGLPILISLTNAKLHGVVFLLESISAHSRGGMVSPRGCYRYGHGPSLTIAN